MKVLGLDTALASLGYAVVHWDDEGPLLTEYNVLTTTPKETEGQRLKTIRAWLESFLEVRQPDLVVLERPILRGKIVYNALIIGMAYGVVLETCARAGVKVKEYFPTDIKYTLTGARGTKKPAMRVAVSERLGVPTLKGADDGIDAVAIALTWIIKEQHDREEVARVR